MAKATKYTEQEWLGFVERVLKGENLSTLAEEADYKLPFFSTKVKSIAKQYGYLNDYLLALKNQKIHRNNGVSYAHIRENYVKEALLKTTEWKPVKGYENSYEVSDAGLVRNSRKELLSPSVSKENTNFYIKYNLSKNSKKESIQVHRLVALSFKPITNSNELQVDHLDNNSLNNHISNLEWVTPSENIQRSFERNNTSKKEICSKGGKLGGQTLSNRAKLRLTNLMGNRFIELKDGCVTYICERCVQQHVTPVTSKAFRYGWKGVCTPCKRIINKEKSR